MDFWNKQVNVSKAAATRQVEIINSFPAEKRFRLALEFASLGVEQTRAWIKQQNPAFSDLEITLEYVRLIYVGNGEMNQEQWSFFQKTMQEKIRKDWIKRFRKMMRDKHWTYDDVARLGNFKNGQVVKATVARGLPAFAKVAVHLHEQQSK